MNAPVQERTILVDQERLQREDATALQISAPAARPIATVGEPGALLAAITAAASNKDIDVGKVERLWVIHQAVVAQNAETAYNAAMSRAQAKILPVLAKSFNSHTQSNYAKLEAIDRAITPIITSEGFSVSYDTETRNDADPIHEGMIRTVAWVRHAAGHKEKHHIDLPPDDAGSQGKVNKTKVQARGSTNAYARRYLKLMIFNVSTFDDKDGNAGRKPREERQQEGQQEDAGALPLYPDEKFNKTLPEWRSMVGAGKKTLDQIKATVGSKYRFTASQLKRLDSIAGAKA